VEVLLEHAEVEELLREALKARGTKAPPGSIMRVRRNNKLGTIRVVFTDKPVKDKP
jgi:hypothetical protein